MSELSMPWAPRHHTYCAPGRLILKISLGEAPDDIPTVRDVRTGYAAAASRIDGGGVDRVFSHFTDMLRITRLHGAAASRHRFGRRHLFFSDAEQAFGLARTFRIEVGRGTAIGDLVMALRQVANVEWAAPHYLSYQPMHGVTTAPVAAAPSLDVAWRTRQRIRAAEALALEAGDPAVIIGILDTGVHPAAIGLDAPLRAGFDTVQLGGMDVAAGMQLLGDLSDEDMDPDDDVGHGTGCAGIIGARGSQLPPGLAGACSLLPMRVLGAASTPGRSEPVGIGAIADIDDGFKRAVDLGAKVLNLSFGTPVDSLLAGEPMPHTDVVKYALSRGCVLVAASGNTGTERAFAPACLDGVIAVGATDGNDRVCDFSTRGAHVALCAPGEQVVSCGLSGLTRLTGTSFAAPFVSAASALLVSHASRRAVPLDSARVSQLLRDSARPFAPGEKGGCGTGVLDVAAALTRLDQRIDAGELAGSDW